MGVEAISRILDVDVTCRSLLKHTERFTTSFRVFHTHLIMRHWLTFGLGHLALRHQSMFVLTHIALSCKCSVLQYINWYIIIDFCNVPAHMVVIFGFGLRT